MTRNLADLLAINTSLTHAVLVGFIRSEVQRAGFRRAVLGLSGGIDSAVTCYLTAEALGPENVLAVMMPYRSSNPASLADAQRVVADLEVRSEIVDITPMADAFFAQTGEMTPVRQGNVMARLRMIVLYDRSAAQNALVIGTSNKTELLLGYGTQYGDLASAINPIGDLYKTQLRELARYIGVPAPIIEKPPSADLWVGQTDEGELGFRYEEVDRLLFLLIDERYTAEEAIRAGFDPEFVRLVERRIRLNQYKRLPPLIAKISPRTIGKDFLYPRDWGT